MFDNDNKYGSSTQALRDAASSAVFAVAVGIVAVEGISWAWRWHCRRKIARSMRVSLGQAKACVAAEWGRGLDKKGCGAAIKAELVSSGLFSKDTVHHSMSILDASLPTPLEDRNRTHPVDGNNLVSKLADQTHELAAEAAKTKFLGNCATSARDQRFGIRLAFGISRVVVRVGETQVNDKSMELVAVVAFDKNTLLSGIGVTGSEIAGQLETCALVRDATAIAIKSLLLLSTRPI